MDPKRGPTYFALHIIDVPIALLYNVKALKMARHWRLIKLTRVPIVMILMMNHLAYTYFDKLLELGSKKLFFFKEHDMLLIAIGWFIYFFSTFLQILLAV